MKKNQAIQKALEQAFWLRYPHLNPDKQYTLGELYSCFWCELSELKKADYERQFWQLVDNNVLPLLPVIPIGNEACRYQLNYWEW